MAKVKPFHHLDKNGDVICMCCGESFRMNYAAKRCRPCADLWEALKLKTHNIMYWAKRLGRLPRIDKETKCVDCGKPAYGYDHRDYFKPLDVVPVCRPCNFARGAATGHTAEEIQAYLAKPPDRRRYSERNKLLTYMEAKA